VGVGEEKSQTESKTAATKMYTALGKRAGTSLKDRLKEKWNQKKKVTRESGA